MIKLFYYHNNNFGDELSPYVVKKLSGEDVSFCYPFSIKRIIRNIVAIIHLCLMRKPFDAKTLLTFSFDPVLIAVGSLLESANRHCVVWGTGMAQPLVHIPRIGRVKMCRGYLSKAKIEQGGSLVESEICGDPALLLPLIFNPNVTKKYDIGIVPHTSHYDEICKIISGGTQVINLRTDDVEDVIRQIKQCKIIFSTSLHGLIVAHSYGLPAVWIHYKDLTGGSFKFHDYFSSVGIEPYRPMEFKEFLEENFRVKLREDQMIISSTKLQQIQRALVKTFPYELKNSFEI